MAAKLAKVTQKLLSLFFTCLPMTKGADLLNYHLQLEAASEGKIKCKTVAVVVKKHLISTTQEKGPRRIRLVATPPLVMTALREGGD